MSKSIKESIEVFITELQARIDLFSSSIVSSNVDSNRDNFNELVEIISGYTNTPVENITLSDLHQVSLIDIKKILKLIGTESKLINEIINKIKDDPNNLNIYEVIRTNISLYAKNYLSINETQNALIASKIKEYQKYIDLIVNENFKELFEDINGLEHVMTSINLENEDKWRILRYVAQMNYQHGMSEEYVNLVSKCNEIISKYIPEEPTDIHRKIIKYISDSGLDIDLIPTIAEKIAFENNYNKYDIQNCLVSLVLSTLCDEYTKKEEEREEILLNIKDVLTFVIPVTNEIIMTSKEILESSAEFMSNCIESGNTDFDHYQNTTITELAHEYNSREIAIDLKKLPILKTIAETLDHIERCVIDSEEYNLCCSTLVELTDAFYLIDEKKRDL